MFDIEQRITEPSLTVCPTTGQPVVRIITGGAGLVFKGTGFYLTDYARKKDGSAPRSSSRSEGQAESKAEPKSESKSESAGSGSAQKTAPTDGGKASGPS